MSKSQRKPLGPSCPRIIIGERDDVIVVFGTTRIRFHSDALPEFYADVRAAMGIRDAQLAFERAKQRILR